MGDTRWDDPDFSDDGSIDVEHYPLPVGLVEVWDEVVAEHDAKSRTKKSRSRHPTTGFGHRDNLKPGMLLPLRKGDCRDGEDHSVSILNEGRFGWNGNEYPNGRQLLKAITQRPSHRLTVRRYFSLGGERGLGIVEDLREALLNKAIVAKRGETVYLMGNLEQVPSGYLETEDSAALSHSDAKELLDYLRSEE